MCGSVGMYVIKCFLVKKICISHVPQKFKAREALEHLCSISRAFGKQWPHLASIFNYVFHLGVRTTMAIRISGVSFTWIALGPRSQLSTLRRRH